MKGNKTIVGWIIFLSMICAVITQFLVNTKIEAKVTNIGFAILIGFASVCFSWARTYEKTEEARLREYIRGTGESALLTSVTFLIASMFKYADYILISLRVKNEFFSVTLMVISWLFFFLAVLGGILLLVKIFKIVVLHTPPLKWHYP